MHQLIKKGTMKRYSHHNVKDFFAYFDNSKQGFLVLDLLKTCLYFILFRSSIQRTNNLFRFNSFFCSLVLLMTLDDVNFEVVMLCEFFLTHGANNLFAVLPYVLDADAIALPMYPLYMLL